MNAFKGREGETAPSCVSGPSTLRFKPLKLRRQNTAVIYEILWTDLYFSSSTPGHYTGRGCGGEPGATGAGFRPFTELHSPAGSAAVAVAGPDPRSDRHLGSHLTAAAAGHTPAGTHTRTHTQEAINMSVSFHPSVTCSVNTAPT